MSPFINSDAGLRKKRRFLVVVWWTNFGVNFQVSVSIWGTWTAIRTLMKLNLRSPSSSPRKALKFRMCDLVGPSKENSWISSFSQIHASVLTLELTTFAGNLATLTLRLKRICRRLWPSMARSWWASRWNSTGPEARRTPRKAKKVMSYSCRFERQSNRVLKWCLLIKHLNSHVDSMMVKYWSGSIAMLCDNFEFPESQRFVVFPPSERDARTLFVKNLPYSVTQDDLKELFDQAVDIRVPMGSNGSSRG